MISIMTVPANVAVLPQVSVATWSIVHRELAAGIKPATTYSESLGVRKHDRPIYQSAKKRNRNGETVGRNGESHC